jgi:ankyrin repeat protein
MEELMVTACRNGNAKEVNRLFDAGWLEDVNGVDIGGWTYIMEALQAGQWAVVELLHAKGADLSRVTGSGFNMLHHAASGGNVECIELVLANTPIDVNSKDDYGDMPIIFTINDSLMASNLLVERGANLFLKYNDGHRAIDHRDNGPRVLQHAKNYSNELRWSSVRPLLLLSKACSMATDG